MKIKNIDKTLAIRYMGQIGEIPPVIAELADDCERCIIEAVEPKFIWRAADMVISDKKIIAPGCNFLVGNDIANHLAGCNKVIIFAVTLTAEADRLISTAQASSELRAFAIDAMCSAVTEQILDIAEEEILSRFAYTYRTARYSPGYGDFPLDVQPSLLQYLDARRKIGLTVTHDQIMIPRKSVTAVFGIFTGAENSPLR